MKIGVSDKNRNIAFMILLVLILISLFIVNNLGNKQDAVFKEESDQYRYALKLLGENEIEEAGSLLEPLVKGHPENPELLRSYSIVQQHVGKFEEAAASLQKAQDTNNFYVKDPTFLAQFGEVLYRLEDYSKAKVYLEESLKMNPEEPVLGAVNTLLENIEAIEN